MQALLLQNILAKESKTLNEIETLDRYYQNFFSGEMRTQNYTGQLDSRTLFNEQSGDLIFLDDQF